MRYSMFAQIADDVGFESLAFQNAMDNRLEAIVDGLYANYERRARLKKGTKRVAAGYLRSRKKCL